MGVTKKKEKLPPSVEAATPPVLSSGELYPVEQSRNASGIDVESLPRLDLPSQVAGRLGKYQVVINRSVLNDIRDHALSNCEVEVCGVIVGSVYGDASGPWGYVTANIRGNFASARNAQVTFTSETWTDIHRQMEERFPKQRILGWYHSHPGFGIFLSEMDVFIQEHFFAASWQIAFVDDPKGGDRGVFVWRDGKPLREEFLIEEDLGAGAVDEPQTVVEPNAGAQIAVEPHGLPPAWAVITAAAIVVAALAGFAFWWLR
jgi:proteasome lid subunit RPN8/RPN11